jgi:hypothetical protein
MSRSIFHVDGCDGSTCRGFGNRGMDAERLIFEEVEERSRGREGREVNLYRSIRRGRRKVERSSGIVVERFAQVRAEQNTGKTTRSATRTKHGENQSRLIGRDLGVRWWDDRGGTRSEQKGNR